MTDVNPVTGKPMVQTEYQLAAGSTSVRGTSKAQKRFKHSTEITCNSWVFALFAVGVASTILGIFLTFFATIQSTQAGVAFMSIGTMIILVAATAGRVFGNPDKGDDAARHDEV